jgi:hypothetical protein
LEGDEYLLERDGIVLCKVPRSIEQQWPGTIAMLAWGKKLATF